MRDQRGVALAAVLLALVAITALASGLAASLAAGLRSASYAADGARAQSLAEAGVEAALAQVCPDGRLPNGDTLLNGSLGGGTFQVRLDPSNRKIESEGQFGRARQRVVVTYTWRPPTPAARAVFAGGDWRVGEKTRAEGAVYAGGKLTLASDLTVSRAPSNFGEGSEAKVEAGSVIPAGGRLQAERVSYPHNRTLGRPPRYREWFRRCADKIVTGSNPIERGMRLFGELASSGSAGRLIYVDGDVSLVDVAVPVLDRLISYTGTATVYVNGDVCAPLGIRANAGNRLWVIAEGDAWVANTGFGINAFIESMRDVHIVGILRLVDLSLLCGLRLSPLDLLLGVVSLPARIDGGVAAGGALEVDSFPVLGRIIGWVTITANPSYQLNPPPGAGVPHISEWMIRP